MLYDFIKRLQNRQIARTLNDLKDLNLPLLAQERIKKGFYDFADDLIQHLKLDTQHDNRPEKE